MKSGWSFQPLGVLCDVLDSRRKPITKKDRIAGEYPYYGATGILDYVEDYIFDEELVLIGEDGAKWGAGENTAFIARGKYWVNNHAHVIRPNRDIVLDEWLISYLNFADLSKYITGLTVPKLNQAKMREIAIPVASLSEQQRIVAILDEAFVGIATATANAEKNLQNARELFESTLQSVFAEKGEGWEEKRLEDVGVTQTGSTPKSAEKGNYGDYIPFIKPADFNMDGSLVYDNSGLSERGLLSARKVSSKSVLMVCIGATIGKCGWSDRDVTTNQQINSLTPNKTVSYKFIYYQMLTRDFQRRVLGSSGQATLPIINKSKWSSLTIWLPAALHEQQRVVNRLDSIRHETLRLESNYQRKLSELTKLKQSILQKAFAGELH